jgi:hypothetical protein
MPCHGFSVPVAQTVYALGPRQQHAFADVFKAGVLHHVLLFFGLNAEAGGDADGVVDFGGV